MRRIILVFVLGCESVKLVFCCKVLQSDDRCVLLLLLCDARHEVPH